MHTSENKHIKRVKERRIPLPTSFYIFSYCLFFTARVFRHVRTPSSNCPEFPDSDGLYLRAFTNPIVSLPASSSVPRQIIRPCRLSSRTMGFSGFLRPPDGAIRHHPNPFPVLPIITRSCGHVRVFARSAGPHRPDGLYALYAVKNAPMHAMWEHNSEKDCIQCIQEDDLAWGVGLRTRKCMHMGMHTDCIRNAYKHIRRVKRENSSFYFLFILPVPSISTVRVFGQLSSDCSRFQAFTDPIEPS